ncbi:hypothetical protein [Microbacterium sp. MMO-10]|uniref:hypothetical protein n=1 Tax=Microbacterium sp. MMO-10 TaxID=3081272 RepID=UPI0030175BB5
MPVGTDGILSPFRANVEILMTIRAGDFAERVSLGTFRAMAVPSTSETVATVLGSQVSVASRVEIKFVSLDEATKRDSFLFPERSLQGASVYAELRRLSGLPVEVTVPDRLIAAEKAWEAAQGGRLKAVHELGRLLDADMIVNSRGAWVPIPDEIGDPVGVLTVGADGTITDIGSEITTDSVYNVVVGSFEDENRVPFYCVAQVTEGPLAVDGLYGRNVRYYSSDLVKTKEQGDAAVAAVLAQSVGSQMYDVEVQCHVNPLVEIGDVWEARGQDRAVVGRVRKVSMSGSHLMNVTIRASRRLA